MKAWTFSFQCFVGVYESSGFRADAYPCFFNEQWMYVLVLWETTSSIGTGGIVHSCHTWDNPKSETKTLNPKPYSLNPRPKP